MKFETFEAAISASDKVLKTLRKKPLDSGVQRSLRDRNTTKHGAKEHIQGLVLLSDTFERILDTVPKKQRIVVFGPQRGHIPGLLRDENEVVWVSTGNSSISQTVVEIKNKFPKTFRLVPKTLASTVTKQETGDFDMVVVDVNTPHRTELVANVASPLFRSLISEGFERLVVIGRVPLLPSAASLVTCTWLALAELGITGSTLRTQSPDEFNWAVAFAGVRGRPAELDRDLAKLWTACLKRSLPESAVLVKKPGTWSAVFDRATGVLEEESSWIGEHVARSPDLEESEWTPVITNAWRGAERPYTPALYSPKARQIGFTSPNDIVERVYETGSHEPVPVCHWGQLKLHVSELEFFAKCRAKGLLRGATVVYIGTSPGHHINILVTTFPEIKKWVLADPDPIRVTHDKVEIMNAFVTDDMVVQLKQKLDFENASVLYINDMRTTTDESAVASEMLNQAKWGIHLRAKAMLLKFRLPYLSRDGTFTPLAKSKEGLTLVPGDAALVLDYSRRNRKKCLEGGETPGRRTTVFYLRGDVQTQVFAPSISTETRLLVFPDKKGRYAMDAWDVRSYEWCMHDFNNGLRLRQDGYAFAPGLPVPARVGIDDGYECVRMVNAFKMAYGAEAWDREMNSALDFLEAATGRNFVDCPTLTITKLAMNKKQSRDYITLFELWLQFWENRKIDHRLFVSGVA